MAKANKTKVEAQDPAEFIAAVPDERRRTDAERLSALMAEVSGEPARMWGSSIVGFGQYRYRYDSGREGDASLVAFSPRKDSLVLYLGGEEPERGERLARLGKHKDGVSCVYVKRLSDVDEGVLREMIAASVAQARAKDVG